MSFLSYPHENHPITRENDAIIWKVRKKTIFLQNKQQNAGFVWMNAPIYLENNH